MSADDIANRIRDIYLAFFNEFGPEPVPESPELGALWNRFELAERLGPQYIAAVNDVEVIEKHDLINQYPDSFKSAEDLP